MALISYGIALSSTPTSAGPDYNVFDSTNCVDYVFRGVVNIPTSGSIDYIDIEETSTCIRLVSRGECQNGVVSGSSPSADPYNTYRLRLSQKNGAGPEYIVSQNTGSLYTYLDTIELPAQNSTAVVNPSPDALALRVRSNGTCQNSIDLPISSSVTPTPTPTPSPTPSPTPTPGPTPTPSPTPAPTPSNCFQVDVFQSAFSPTDACCNVISTIAYLNSPILASATVAYSQRNFNCSDVLSNPTYMTQDLNNYYFWNGSSFSGPTSCPGCP